MSATNVPKADGTLTERHADDAYMTPRWCIGAILPHLGRAHRTLDPCCGDGAILDAFGVGAAYGIEIDPGRESMARAKGHEVVCADALALPPTLWRRPDRIVTNPPFALALPFLERALAEVAEGGTVAFLLRLAWMAGRKRAAFHRAHPSDVYVLSKRPSFTANGKSDSAEYAWFCFGPGRGGRWSVLDVESRDELPASTAGEGASE
ncbi:MAG TPA: class I SAM-dependent methyltransferase [Usitatibacter sp.]|nr:class I SAM-dependent methyltransferase [Usitatibacter sp.]